MAAPQLARHVPLACVRCAHVADQRYAQTADLNVCKTESSNPRLRFFLARGDEVALSRFVTP